MDNEKKKYWFFGSKLNSVLLIVLIVLMVFALKEMQKNQDYYKENLGLKDTPKTPVEETISEKETANSYNNTTLNLSDPYTSKYKTIFEEALKKPANFNNHYVVVSYGCGSGCVAYGVVDKNTGKAYQGPSDDYGGNYQVPPSFETNRYSIDSNTFKVVGYNTIQTYKFENGQFIIIQ
jgi:hypothetical protein